MYFNEYSWPFMGFSGFFIILFWFLIVFGVIYLVKVLSNSDNDNIKDNENNALNILKKRYAKGEISKKEFEEIKNDLK